MSVRRDMAWKFGLLACLYFSQGLPFGFFTQALPVMLRNHGLSLEEIGLTSLLALPWALKFLWSPVVDRWSFRSFGRRKSWIVPLQLSAVVVLLAAAVLLEPESTTALMIVVFTLNLVAATQDIATDGLAVDMLAPEERGFANGLQVAGYRVGMIIGGGALLIMHDELGWSGTFVSMAVMTGVATLPILLSREPPPYVAIEDRDDRRPSVMEFLRRPGMWRVLVLIATYKAGDAFATSMLRPYLADIGLTLSQVGWLLGTVGFVAGLVGALVGGATVNAIGRKRSLLLFGALQAVAVAGYAIVATGTPTMTTLYVACAWEHLAGGLATAALFTCMMDWCSPESSATDYTTQASIVVIATGTASAIAGFSAGAFGYVGHFTLATVGAAAALVVVAALFPDD